MGRKAVVECGEVDERTGGMTMIDSFVVQGDLVGLAIGAKGTNVERARRLPDVLHIDTTTISDGALHGQDARAHDSGLKPVIHLLKSTLGETRIII